MQQEVSEASSVYLANSAHPPLPALFLLASCVLRFAISPPSEASTSLLLPLAERFDISPPPEAPPSLLLPWVVRFTARPPPEAVPSSLPPLAASEPSVRPIYNHTINCIFDIRLD